MTTFSMIGWISCRGTSALLWEFLDGELDAAGTDRVRAHLSACPQCRAREAHGRAYLRRMSAVGGPTEAPPALRRRVLHSLRAHGLRA